MAGESPDKSEQRKSSGVTTPDTSDPRLAVFRDASEPEASAVSGSQSGDARLRAAVAAWVAKADGPSSPDAESSEPSGEDGDADASAAADGGAEPAGEREGREGSEPAEEGAQGASVAAPADVASSGASESAEARTDASGDADDVDDSDGVDSSDGSGDDGDAVADASKGETRAGEARADDAEEPEAADAKADTAEADAESEPEPESGVGPEADSTADAGKAKPEADAKSDTDADDGGADDSDDTEGDGAKPDAKAKAKVKAESDADDAPEADLPEADAPEADAKATAGDTDAKKPAADDTDDAGDGDTDDAEDSSDVTQANPVDQPTGVFRVPTRPVVDRPTTTLKRSTFVPLRPDDVPGERKKKPAPVPAPAGPPSEAPAATLTVPTWAAGGTGTAEAAPADIVEPTRQQPMPPKPPLDLLAELTNTPPPRQTPVRTVVRRFKIWTPLVVLLLIIFAVAQAVRPLPTPTLGLSAEPTYTFSGGKLSMPWPGQGQSAVTVDGVGSMGTDGTQTPAPIASMAKVMTAYVVLKDHPLSGKQQGPEITVDKQAGDEANSPDESTAPIKEGQHFTERQMLELLLVPSGNNAARLFSRWDGPSADFVKKMNAAAKDLGMTHTTYTDPSGLNRTTQSTASDQLKLAAAVMKNDVFAEIVNLPQVKVPGIDTTIYNNNTLLLNPGVSGIKTGSSTPAGGNLLWAADTVVDGKTRRILGVVMGQQSPTKVVNDSLDLAKANGLKLIQHSQKTVTSATVVKKGDVVGYVDDGLGGKTPVVATKDLKAVGWPGLKVDLEIGDGGKAVPHSAKAGTVVGQVTVGSGTGQVAAPVALQKDLAEPGFGAKLTRLG
ncbi:D-alanyl-D-alanine carboxypeptidase [Streptomyces sp. NBC_01014]|uniref:D-alanyl-D-alanine carboxypeptidase n=1 Tax=Streptomyces sp. NBC_01014 TaxID=2903719 RepID=UPI00386AB7AD|nr:D-alanyl-D-alanine carboxypeptidase [Streptomyces sp. NBC_01014]